MKMVNAGQSLTKTSGRCAYRSLVTLSTQNRPPQATKAELPPRKMEEKGTRVGTRRQKVGIIMSIPTVKKGGQISRGKSRFAGIIKWKCAPEQIANFPTYVLGAEWPTQGINVITEGKLSQTQDGGPIQNGGPIQSGGTIQNGVQIQNGAQDGGPTRFYKLDLLLRNPLILTTPLSANKSILNAHKLNNVLSREVCTPPQRVEPHALPPGRRARPTPVSHVLCGRH